MIPERIHSTTTPAKLRSQRQPSQGKPKTLRSGPRGPAGPLSMRSWPRVRSGTTTALGMRGPNSKNHKQKKISNARWSTEASAGLDGRRAPRGFVGLAPSTGVAQIGTRKPCAKRRSQLGLTCCPIFFWDGDFACQSDRSFWKMTTSRCRNEMAIQSLRLNKSYDECGLPTELLKQTPHALLHVSLELFNHVLVTGDAWARYMAETLVSNGGKNKQSNNCKRFS